MSARALHHSLSFAALLFVLAACGSGQSSSGLLGVGAASDCRSTCARLAFQCAPLCNLACEGYCSGSLPASDFPYVDSVQCATGSVSFQKGGASLTCGL